MPCRIWHSTFKFQMIFFFYIIGSVLQLFHSSTISTESPLKFDQTATGILKSVNPLSHNIPVSCSMKVPISPNHILVRSKNATVPKYNKQKPPGFLVWLRGVGNRHKGPKIAIKVNIYNQQNYTNHYVSKSANPCYLSATPLQFCITTAVIRLQ